MEKLKIFVTHRIDKESFASNNELLYNIRCGATFDQSDSKIFGDDTGINISDKRLTYCELTTQYWAWKNYDSEYYGFCHYRRYLSFSEANKKTDIYGNIIENYINDKVLNSYGYNDIEKITNMVQKYDFIIAEPCNTKMTNEGTVYEQYCNNDSLYKRDLDVLIKLIKNKYSNYYESLMSYLNGHMLYPCNMFIMNKVLFNDYNEWLFAILADLEKEIEITKYSEESIRTIGHLAERLLGVYFIQIKQNKLLRTHVCQRFFALNTMPEIEFNPLSDDNVIPIMLSSSDYYVPFLITTMHSILKNSSSLFKYDFIILHSEISQKSMKVILDVFEKKENCNIRFYDVRRKIENYDLKINNHISVEAFYRLMCHDIFKNFEKIIYIDIDVIVKGDISELYNIPLGECLIGATRDADFICQYNGMIKKVKVYSDKVLKLENPYNYFQAGVLIFNINEMKKAFTPTELIMFASEREYMYMDQDVLNVKCQNRVHFINADWNVLTDCAGVRLNNIRKFAPYEIYREYLVVRENPKIIHYAGFSKPWNNPSEDYANEFWSIASELNIYEVILARLNTYISWHVLNVHEMNKKNTKMIIKTKVRLKNFIYKIYVFAFPEGSKRRNWIRRKYYCARG